METFRNATPNHLTWGAFFYKNLIPVTVGNIIGGAVLWALPLVPYLRRPKGTMTAPAQATWHTGQKPVGTKERRPARCWQSARQPRNAEEDGPQAKHSPRAENQVERDHGS